MATITDEMYIEFGKAVKNGLIPRGALKGVANESDAVVSSLLNQIRELQKPQELKSDTGGLFEYDVDYKGHEGTIRKANRLSPENLIGAYAKEYNVPSDSVGEIGVDERIIDDPNKLTDYIMDNKLNNDMPRAEVKQSIASTPRWAKAQILEKGIIPQAWSLTGDALSGAGRSIKGVYEQYLGDGDGLTAMGEAEPHAKGFWPNLGESILKSPVTPIAFGSGALLGSATKTGTAVKGGLMGLGEAVTEESFRDASGETQSGFGDYAQEGALGGAFGSVAPFAPAIIKGALGGSVDLAKKATIGGAKMLSNRLGAGVEAGLTSSPASKGNATALETGLELGLKPDEIPMSILHGTNSVKARAERAVAQGPEGQGQINKYENAYNTVNNRIDDFSNLNKSIKPMEAGAEITQGLVDSRSNLFDKNTNTYNSVLDDVDLLDDVNDKLASEYAPQLQENLFYAIDDIDKKLVSAVDDTQIKALNKAKQSLTRITDKLEVADEGGNTYEILNGVRTSLGEIAYDKNIGKFEILDSYLKTLTNAEREVSETLMQAVKGADGPKGELLESTNKAISEHFTGEKSLTKILGKDGATDKQFKSIFGDTKKVQELKTILEGNGQGDIFNRARDSWVNSNLIKRDGEGAVLYASTLKNIEKNSDLIKSMYGDDANKMVATYKNLLGFGKELGQPFIQGSAGQLDFKGLVLDPLKAKVGKGVLASKSYGDISKLGGIDPASISKLNAPFRSLGRGIAQTLAQQPEIFKNWYNQGEDSNLGLKGLGGNQQ